MKLTRSLMAGVALAMAFGSASAGNDFDYCLLCHGANANGNYGIRAPKLSGMEPWYLARQLENFAAGTRGVPAVSQVYRRSVAEVARGSGSDVAVVVRARPGSA